MTKTKKIFVKFKQLFLSVYITLDQMFNVLFFVPKNERNPTVRTPDCYSPFGAILIEEIKPSGSGPPPRPPAIRDIFL